MLFDVAVYMGGDSYPTCAPIESTMMDPFATMFGTWIGHREVAKRCGLEDRIGTYSLRAARLGRLLESAYPGRSIVLIGRSSGARVASLVAAHAAVAAVVCLGYPFRHPRRGFELERVAHLAAMTTPTLIVQGRADEYGGQGQLSDYVLSPSVRTFLVDGAHDFRLSRADWSQSFQQVQSFLDLAHDGSAAVQCR